MTVRSPFIGGLLLLKSCSLLLLLLQRLLLLQLQQTFLLLLCLSLSNDSIVVLFQSLFLLRSEVILDVEDLTHLLRCLALEHSSNDLAENVGESIDEQIVSCFDNSEQHRLIDLEVLLVPLRNLLLSLLLLGHLLLGRVVLVLLTPFENDSECRSIDGRKHKRRMEADLIVFIIVVHVVLLLAELLGEVVGHLDDVTRNFELDVVLRHEEDHHFVLKGR
ncbi:hypothetical protein PFISCL1PPCAC_27624, partial [Pristionchus fissidentatus]